MMPAQFHIDLFDELRDLVGAFEPVVLSGVLRELDGISQKKGRDGAAARLGIHLGERCTIADSKELESGSIDAQMIEYAVQKGCIVVTNDRGIRDILFERGLGVISMRNQKKLELLRK